MGAFLCEGKWAVAEHVPEPYKALGDIRGPDGVKGSRVVICTESHLLKGA